MVIVLIPAFNEEHGLRQVLSGLPQRVAGREVRSIVLNDGSTDATADVARQGGVELLDLATNRGKGAALKAGLGAITHDKFDALVLMDADGQHDTASLEEIVTPVLEGSVDIVVGSRYIHDVGRGVTPWNRYVVRTVVRSSLWHLFGVAVTDPFSGYRALSPRAVRCLRLRGDRYESELEMLFCAERNDLTIREVPIAKIYGARTSKMDARFGPLLGRIDVVSRYAATIAREVLRSRRHTEPAEDRVKNT